MHDESSVESELSRYFVKVAAFESTGQFKVRKGKPVRLMGKSVSGGAAHPLRKRVMRMPKFPRTTTSSRTKVAEVETNEAKLLREAQAMMPRGTALNLLTES